MIDKKTPKVSDPAEEAGTATALDPSAPVGLEALMPDISGPDEPTGTEHAAGVDDDEELLADDYEIDPEEQARKRKRQANMVQYGGVALLALAFGYVAYPHFKKYFVTEQPHVQHIGGVPFPQEATKHHFSLTNDDTKPQAPPGSMSGGPRGALPDDIASSGGTSVAPPPEVHPELPTTTAHHVDTARADIDALTKPHPVVPMTTTIAPPATPEVTPPPVLPPSPSASPVVPAAELTPSTPVTVAPPPVTTPAVTVASPPAAPVLPATSPPPANTNLPVIEANHPAATPSPATSPSTVSPPLPVNTLPPPASNLADNKSPGQPHAYAQDPVRDLTNRVATLQGTVTALATSRDTTDAKLKQIQDGLDEVQREIGDLARVESSTPAPRHAVVAEGPARPVERSVPRPSPVAHQAVKWELRSATPGMALLAHPGDQSLQRVAVGDMVSGLGRITSISEHDGNWVVRGTSGSVRQLGSVEQ